MTVTYGGYVKLSGSEIDFSKPGTLNVLIEDPAKGYANENDLEQ